MSDFATLTITDTALIASEDQRNIPFKPVAAGPIRVVSKPKPVPLKSQTETGLLGRIEILRPGSNTPVASVSVPAGGSELAANYTATAADLAAPGNFTCRVINASLINSTFTTSISYQSDFEIRTASFDMGLLGAMLAEVASTAAVRVRLEGSDANTKASVISWSAPIADLALGHIEYRFNISDTEKDFTTFRLHNLNSDPATPVIYLVGSGNSLGVGVSTNFLTDGASLQAISGPLPDISIREFGITLTIGFDGSITAECDVSAILPINSTDESADVKSAVETEITSRIADLGLTPAVLKPYIDNFFVQLLRLDDAVLVGRQVRPGKAQITQYAQQGNSLVVSYFLQPQNILAHPIAAD
jgi:hypothetical protein